MARPTCPFFGLFLGLALLAAGGDAEASPLGTITLTGPSGVVAYPLADNYTFAFPHRVLAPLSFDPPGTTHTLSFEHPAPQRQEILAFDLDWSEPIVSGPQPTIDYVPVVTDYVSVLSGETATYTFTHAATAHIVRYWHGACAASTPWKELFDPISEGVFIGLAKGAAAQGASSIARLYDVFQPYFIGAYDTIEHGFSFEAYYDIHGGPFSFLYKMNPAYEIHIRPEDGLVQLESVHQGVVPSSPALQQALQNDVPTVVSKTINDRLTIPLYNPTLPTPCDLGASITEQQEFCFGAAVVGDSGPSNLERILKVGFEQAGYDTSLAEWATEQMLAGLEPRNFACVAVPESTVGSCAIHPVIQRVNVLPDELELVFAAEDDPFEKIFFYQSLSTIAAALVPDAKVPELCWSFIGRTDGTVPMFDHGFEYEDL